MVLLKAYNSIFKSFKKGRFIRPFFYLLFISLVMPASADASPKLVFQFESTSYSEATSLEAISGNWNDKVTSGNKVWSINRLSLGYQQDGFIVQSLFRKDFNYSFDNETVRFLALSNNQLDLEVGKNYALEINPNNVSAKGMRFGLTKKLSEKLKVKAFVSLLKATNVLEGKLLGTATAVAVNDYNFNFESDMVYQDDPLFGRETGAVSGRGYAIDVFIDYQINDALSLNVELFDLAGEIVFNNVFFTKATATSDVKSFDDDGYVQYNPSISGIDGERRYVKKLQGRQKYRLKYSQSKDKSFMFEHQNVFGYSYQKFLFQKSYKEHQLILSVLPKLEALGVELQYSNFSIGLETDDIKKRKIKYLMIKAQMFYRF